MIFAIYQLQEKCREQNIGLHMVFVDHTKTFDAVNCEGLRKIFGKFCHPEKLISLIASFYDVLQARVLENSDTSKPS